MHQSPPAASLDAPDEVPGTVTVAEPPQALHRHSPRVESGSVLHVGDAAEAALLNRVGRVLQDMNAGREVTDAEVLQHQSDCRLLFEQAHARWLQGCESREVVEQWQACFLQAGRCLSPAWKAAREAEIQQDIARGQDYFVTAGDTARAALAGRRG